MASPYLLDRRRGLKEACLEIMMARGWWPPCDCCGLDDLCQRCQGDPPKESWFPQVYVLGAGPSSSREEKKAA